MAAPQLQQPRNDPTSHLDPDDETPCTTNKAQHLLCQLTDNTRARLLYHEQQYQEAAYDIGCINDLRHPQVHHLCIYHIDHSEGPVLPPDIYKYAIRHRLCCQFLPEATTCH